jgi:AraC family transcriptional regulator
MNAGMDARTVEAVIARRFELPKAPTSVAHVSALKLPIIFTHLQSAEARRRQSMDVPREQSFSFQVPLTSFPWRAWSAGKETTIPAAIAGRAFLFDLSANPTVGIDTPFSTVRFNISQSALDAVADESELPRASGLYCRSLGALDPVMRGLAEALVPVMGTLDGSANLFVEYVALAFHAHVFRTYGNVPAGSAFNRCGLTRTQFRRACEFIEENLDGDLSIAGIANACGLSSSRFAKAFKQTAGSPPHAWLTARRIERAKHLLKETDIELAEIAIACGFVDQSHLTRVFLKRESCSPGRWRRIRQA